PACSGQRSVQPRREVHAMRAILILAASAVLGVVAPSTQDLKATAKNSGEHGWLLHYEPGGKAVKVSDFHAGLLEITARHDAGGDEDAIVQAEFAEGRHVWRIELNRAPELPSPRIATIEM